MSKYHTKQREQLLEFFESNTDKGFSAVQIAASLDNVSLSAVYRNLAALEGEGMLKRISKTGTREVYYQYIGAPGCRGSIHVSCTGCGRTYHLEQAAAKRLRDSLEANDGFKISCGDTVLYGTCAKCRGGK
ncbi:MAG: transcriptional repressor [Clostridia bacterium]|nr:transcriptional repressor [Clostridia bacterium]